MESKPKILFIINPGSGKGTIDWEKEIKDFFSNKHYEIEIRNLPASCTEDEVCRMIKKSGAAKVVAVGGDGTVKLVAGCIIRSHVAMAILPAGSANGMAKELGIPDNPVEALKNIIEGDEKTIHLVKVNNEICIHLSDIGFNAFVVKKFEDEDTRGMWGYTKAAWKVLWSHSKMEVEMKIGDKPVTREAAMVVIANATKYGNGVVINPSGSLFDDKFEVVIIKKISLSEIFKMRFTQAGFNTKKTELFQTDTLNIRSRKKTHFQVDGEYRGKLKDVKASIISSAIRIIIPKEAGLLK